MFIVPSIISYQNLVGNYNEIEVTDYLNKRKIRDKIRNRIFQYFREGRWLYDSEVEKNNIEHIGQTSRKNRYMEMGRGRIEEPKESLYHIRKIEVL